MQWSLFLLILMGHCSSVTCHLYEYKFVGEEKTWSDAQKHCKKEFTDLATVSNMRDMKRLRRQNRSEAWIGLHNSPEASRIWHWSLPGVEFNHSMSKWAAGEPHDHSKIIENCVMMKNDTWMDAPCDKRLRFICYNDSAKQDKIQMINEEKTWPQAQTYCRKHHTDLVSGLKQLEDARGNYRDESLWIGLFRDSWRWSDGSSFSFRNWHQNETQLDDKKCAVTLKNRWMKKDCTETKPFFCYKDKVILINESKTWEEALYYCRDNYHDLVSITNLDEQRWVQERAKMADTPHVWLGLRYTCALDFWFWISDEAVEYKNWDSPGETDECDMSGAMDSKGQHKWFKKIDNEKFNFICSVC